jgi:hypothetical protein
MEELSQQSSTTAFKVVKVMARATAAKTKTVSAVTTSRAGNLSQQQQQSGLLPFEHLQHDDDEDNDGEEAPLAAAPPHHHPHHHPSDCGCSQCFYFLGPLSDHDNHSSTDDEEEEQETLSSDQEGGGGGDRGTITARSIGSSVASKFSSSSGVSVPSTMATTVAPASITVPLPPLSGGLPLALPSPNFGDFPSLSVGGLGLGLDLPSFGPSLVATTSMGLELPQPQQQAAGMMMKMMMPPLPSSSAQAFSLAAPFTSSPGAQQPLQQHLRGGLQMEPPQPSLGLSELWDGSDEDDDFGL